MMAIPTHTPLFKALIILCVISTFYFIHNISTGRRVPASFDELYSGADDFYHAIVDGKEEAEKAKFISTILQNDIEGPFNGTSIRNLCDSRTWDDSLIFMCEAPAGGVGNVRNFLLNCLRYTIEAGAAFVIPEITPRGIGSVEDLFTNEILPFSYLFDTDHLVNSLNQHCPQLKIHPSIDNLPPSTATPLRLTPSDFQATTFTNALGDMKSINPTTWHDEFQEWLKTNTQITNKTPDQPQSPPPPPTSTNPLLILLHRTLFDFPISHDPPTFINHFGRLFQFRPDVRRIAATTLYAMSKQYHLNINPSLGIEASKFYGAHLRTADDAKAAHWTGYEQQSRNYLSDATSASKETSITKSAGPLGLVYVSSGSSKDMTRFSKDAKNHFFVNTTTKHDLLSSSPAYLPVLEELEKLSWDQQALVDYEILSRSSRFGGTSESSFSWNIAQRRHVVFGMQKQRWDWGTSGQWSGLSGEMKVSFGDGLSTVFGPVDHEGFFGRTMWP